MPELCGKMSLALWRISGLRATKGSGLRGSISGGDKRAVKLSSLPLSTVLAWRVCRIQSASVYAQCLKVFFGWSVTMGQPGTEAFSFFQSREKQSVHPASPAEYPLVLKDSHNGSGMLCVVFRDFAKFCSSWSTSCCLHPFSLCFSKCLALCSMSAECLLLSLCRRCGGAVSCTMVTAAPVSTGLVRLWCCWQCCCCCAAMGASHRGGEQSFLCCLTEAGWWFYITLVLCVVDRNIVPHSV